MTSPARLIDHTMLKADCTAVEIAVLCEEAVEYGFASVCIPPVFIPQAVKLLYGSDVAVCTVVGFPLGYQDVTTKVHETRLAVESGASEIDMVIHLGAARIGDFGSIEDEISCVVAASGEALVKVIIECCLFGVGVKTRLARIVQASGADFVKTSTGFAAAGATLEDVALLSETVSGGIGVKAAGGIRDWITCREMVAAGATRIGASSSVAIIHQWQESEGVICP